MLGVVLVALGGALGAASRYGVSVAARGLSDAPGTYATLFVNVVGSFALGLLMAWLVSRSQAGAVHHNLFLFVGVGLLGGFTTFSAFSLETVHMLNDGALGKAGIYVLANTVASVGALFLAFSLLRRVLA